MNLDMIEDVRNEAWVNVIVRRKQVSKCFNKGVQHGQFIVGDLAFRNCQAIKPASENKKLSSNWK